MQGEIDLNMVLDWIQRLFDGGKTDEQRIHDKGQFEMKCQTRRSSEAGRSDSSLENELFKTGERSAVQTQKEGAIEIICHAEYGCLISQ